MIIALIALVLIIVWAFAPIIISVIGAKKLVDSHPEEENPDIWNEVSAVNSASFISDQINNN